jgi:hypothetical protein
MEFQQLSKTLTEEELLHYEKKASEICSTLQGCSKVHPIVMIVPGTLERKVCYLREPTYDTKIRVMDKSITIGFFSAGEELRQSCVIKEHSDSITYGDGPECDRFKMGVVDECVGMVRRLENQFKKN